MGRYGEIWGDTGRYREVMGGMGRSGWAITCSIEMRSAFGVVTLGVDLSANDLVGVRVRVRVERVRMRDRVKARSSPNPSPNPSPSPSYLVSL